MQKQREKDNEMFGIECDDDGGQMQTLPVPLSRKSAKQKTMPFTLKVVVVGRLVDARQR